MGTKYQRYYCEADDEWVLPEQTGYKMACCDCGLVHKMNFAVHEGQVIFQVFRDERATAAIRRHRARAEKRRGA